MTPTTFVFDLEALCGFVAVVVQDVAEGIGAELREEHWPLVSAAVASFINRQLERMEFAAEAQAALDAIPTTDDAAV